MVGGGREEQEELSIGMTVLGINGIFTPATSCHDTCNTHTHNHKVPHQSHLHAVHGICLW